MLRTFFIHTYFALFIFIYIFLKARFCQILKLSYAIYFSLLLSFFSILWCFPFQFQEYANRWNWKWDIFQLFLNETEFFITYILIVHTCPLPLWIHYNRVFGMNKWSNFRFWPVGCIWRKKISFAFEKQINFLLLKIALFLYLIWKKKWKKVFRFCSHRFICT